MQKSNRTDDFYDKLERIEFQAARLARNPNLDKMSDSNRNLMREKGVHLITAIVRFLNTALLYFSQGVTGMSLLPLSLHIQHTSGKRLGTKLFTIKARKP